MKKFDAFKSLVSGLWKNNYPLRKISQSISYTSANNATLYKKSPLIKITSNQGKTTLETQKITKFKQQSDKPFNGKIEQNYKHEYTNQSSRGLHEIRVLQKNCQKMGFQQEEAGSHR
jgi:hypothetical protein